MIKRIYYNLSLKNKIISVFLILLILPFSISSILSYSISKKVIENRVSSTVLVTFNTINERMESSISDLDEISKVIFFDELLLNILRKQNSGDSISDEELNKMGLVLANILNLKKYMSSIYIYTKSGSVFSSYQANDLYTEKFKNSELYQGVILNKGAFTWVGLSENKYGQPVVIVGRQLIDPISFNEQGVLIIVLYYEFFNNIYKDINLGKNSSFFISDPVGQLLFHTDKNRIRDYLAPEKYIRDIMQNNKGSFTHEVEGSDSLVIFNTSSQTGLKLIGTIPLSELTYEIRRVGLLTGIICAISILIAFIAALFISKGITRPLQKLVSLMEKVKQEDFTVKFVSKYNDEISSVARNFNLMVDKVRELIERIKEEQYQKKNAELRALQAQINPHFLYNTLASIYWSARKAKAEDAAMMTSALSNFFKLGLNKGNEITTIKDELEHAKNYLIIQQYRYKDKFDYVFQVDEEILGCKIVKLVLQPLLENSIIHGIEPMDKKGSITIQGERTGNIIKLRVSDNGLGFDNDNCKDNQNTHINGYGLKNVIERLHLYFGKEYGIVFSSIPGKGTIAEVLIPFLSDRGDLDV